MFVAVGAIFKPVVVGTVARVTNERTSQLGFGIFYMMVNVGGFLGPAISGYLRSPIRSRASPTGTGSLSAPRSSLR